MFIWLTGSASHPPYLLHLRSSKTFIILTVSTAIFTDIFLYGIIVPVVPFALTSRAGIPSNRVQTWISILLAVYGAALLVASPICGWMADRSSSRRAPLLVGLLALAGSTVMLCIGSSIGVLCAGRVLQGFSAAVVWVVGLALLVDTVGPAAVGQTMGYVGLSMSLAVLLAPLLGGVVFAKSGYYAVFAMAFGLILLDVVLRLVMVEKKVARRWLPDEEEGGDEREEAKVDGEVRPDDENRDSPPGMIEMDAVQSTERPDQKPAPTNDIYQDHQPPAPPQQHSKHTWVTRLPPIFRLMASRRILSALWGCLMQASLLTAFDSILPLFVKDTFHWNSTGAGLIFLPLVIATFIGPVIGTMADKYGPRWFATAGFIVGCPFLILLRLVDHDSLHQKVLLCALLALIGVALTLVLTPMMAEITYAVVAKEARRPEGYFGKNGAYAQAYSLFNMAWAGGTLVGPLLAGLVNQSSGWGTATLILGCVSVFTALPTVVWTGGSIFKLRSRRREEGEGGRESVEQV